MVNNGIQGKVLRLVRSTDRGLDGDDCEIVWLDRLLDVEVLRYDGGDPANRPPLGPSDDECLANRGYDRYELVDASACKSPVKEQDVRYAAWTVEHIENTKRADERGAAVLEPHNHDVFAYLGLTESDFSFSNYYEDELRLLKPALEGRGYTNVRFIMGEQDSFGPLSRGIVCTGPEGKTFRFFYG